MTYLNPRDVESMLRHASSDERTSQQQKNKSTMQYVHKNGYALICTTMPSVQAQLDDGIYEK